MKYERAVDLKIPNMITIFGVLGASALATADFPPWVSAQIGNPREFFLSTLILGSLFVTIFYRNALGKFQPNSKIEAKIYNEQLKVIANFLNSASVAILAVFVFAAITNASQPFRADYPIVTLIFVLLVQTAARSVLGFMKSEEI